MATKKELPSYEEIGAGIGRLVAKKQAAYGDSFSRAGDCLRQLFPDGIPLTKYDDVLVIARMLDKIFRIANQEDAFGENPYEDLGGYSILGFMRKLKTIGIIDDSTAKERTTGRNLSRQKSSKRSYSKRQRSQGAKRKIPSKGRARKNR